MFQPECLCKHSYLQHFPGGLMISTFSIWTHHMSYIAISSESMIETNSPVQVINQQWSAISSHGHHYYFYCSTVLLKLEAQGSGGSWGIIPKSGSNHNDHKDYNFRLHSWFLNWISTRFPPSKCVFTRQELIWQWQDIIKIFFLPILLLLSAGPSCFGKI